MAARSILLGLTLISYVQAVVCCLGFALRVEKYKQVEEKRRWPFKAPQARRQDRWDCQCLGQQVWTLKLFWLLAEMLREGGVGVVEIQYRKLKDASVRQEESGSQLQEEKNLSRQQLSREGPGGGWVTRETRSQLHHTVAQSKTTLAWTDWARSLHCSWSHTSSAYSPAPRSHLPHACFQDWALRLTKYKNDWKE